MSTHSRLSPSSRHRWSACPGSVREEAKYPEEKSSPSAIDGTHSHTLLEKCLVGADVITDPFDYVGQTVVDADGTFVVDEARAARVKVAVDHVWERFSERGGEMSAESRVTLYPLTGRTDLYGTADVVIENEVERWVEVIDYKDGIGIVDVVGNPQLEQYALGVLASWKNRLGEEQLPFDRVILTIIQPKAVVKGLPAITSYEMSVQSLLDTVPTLVAQAAATDDPNAPLVPGEKQCQWCRAKGNCAALANSTMGAVGVSFPNITDQTLEVAQQSADKDPATMSDDQIRQILEAAPLLRQLLDATETEALRRANTGNPIPGFKLVEGRGSSAWVYPEEQMATKLTKMGIPKSALYKTSMVTPKQCESLVWEKRDGTKASLTPRQLELLKGEYIVKLGGKPTLVPESDSRPAINQNVAHLFSAVSVAPATESLPSWLL